MSQCLPYAQKIAYIAKAYYGYERRNTSALTSNYLNESPSYYNQESLWVSLILKNKSLSNSIRLQLERYYFKLSYITLLKGLFDKQLWNERFKSHENLLDYGSGFRKTIVSFAFCDHFRIAQFMRTIISKSNHEDRNINSAFLAELWRHHSELCPPTGTYEVRT